MRALIVTSVTLLLAACRQVAPLDNQPPAEENDGVAMTEETTINWREVLTDEQYRINRKSGTEAPFKNKYNDNKEAGIYYDVTGQEPLFSSAHKFDSGTGWPSFWQPIDAANVGTKTDYKLIYPRTEVHSSMHKHHLGHIFKDGPEPTGLRYCINSAALKFVPYEELNAADKALFDATADSSGAKAE